LNTTLNDICIDYDYMRELNQLTGLPRKRLIQAMTRMTLSLHEGDADVEPFWFTNSETQLTLPAPTKQNELPPAPAFFQEKNGQVDSFEIEPQRETPTPVRETRKIARTSHKAIVASRVQSSTNLSVSSSSSGAPPSLNAPPTLGTPGSLTTSQRGNKLMSAPPPPVLTAPSQINDTPAPSTKASAGSNRRQGAMTKRGTTRRTTPRVTPTRTGHSATPSGTEEHAEPEEEADADMPSLQPVPATPPRAVPRPKPATPERKPAPPPRGKPAPVSAEPEHQAESNVSPVSPHTPSSGVPRRALIGQRQPRPLPQQP